MPGAPRRLISALCAGALALCVPGALAQALPDAQRDRILALGPWPPALPPDPSNRVSGRPLAIELGRLLFRDPRMSPVGYIGCVSCHQPDRGFTDAKPRAHGLADLPRNTPALANLRLQRWYGWGGASDSLWLAAIRPIVDEREIGGSPASVRALFVREPDLAACYRTVFGVSPLAQEKRTLVNVGKALAAYVETLATGRTPFDELRDAIAAGDEVKVAAYPAAAMRGLRLFVGEAGCIACHDGANFSDGSFHPGAAPRAAAAGADTGRLDDARRLLASPLNLGGTANDDASRATAAATRALVVDEAMRGVYRTPSLRNVAVTAPYLHDGRADTLREAVQHAPRPSPLPTPQVDDLVAFLRTLTDAPGARRPWLPSDPDTRCRPVLRSSSFNTTVKREHEH